MQAVNSLWFSRILILVVLIFNLQCAFLFLLQPGTFAPAFELTGLPGEAALQGFGVLFLMWNVPYLFAAWNPARYSTSLHQAVIMQTIGLVGESYILYSLNGAHPTAQASILRFIYFDGFGLLALLAAEYFARSRDR